MRSALVLALVFFGIVAPVDAQKKRFAGKRVEIYYDEHMIPHVFGESDAAAFYGLGYHHMMEYPIGTLNSLWLYSGRMAEVAGYSYIDEDRLHRGWELPAIAARHKKELGAKGLLPLIRAYVAGIEDARAWWRGKGLPASSARLDALVGEEFEVHLDRVPDYLNQSFSPFGEYDDPDVLVQMRNVLNRLFDEAYPITVDHVLMHGAVVNSFKLLRSNEVASNALSGGQEFIPPDRPDLFPDSENEIASNGWMVGKNKTQRGFVITHSDGHVGLNKLKIRPYLIQVSGRRYKASGVTMPGYPAIYGGYNNHVSWLITAPAGGPVMRNEWKVTLEPSGDPEDLKFLYHHAGGTETVLLEKVEETLTYFDPLTGQDLTFQDARFYVPVHDTIDPPLGFTRYLVTSGEGVPPLPEEEITFEQSAFTTEGSPWEWMIGMGRTRNASADLDAVLNGGLLIVGSGLNLMVADRGGAFRYQILARVPIQGPDVPPSEYDPGAELDGSLAGWRWQGFHSIDELPSIDADNFSALDEVWINNNASPDLVETSRFTEADLTGFPEYMVSHESVTSWRQERGTELLRGGPPAISRPYNDAVATDKTDKWMLDMYPFFEASRTIAEAQLPLGVSADAELFMTWIEEHRHLDENDEVRPLYDFVAHEFSQVSVYASLLRSEYLNQVLWLDADDKAMGGPGLPPEQLEFGTDPAHVLFEDPSQFNYTNYGPNIDAMVYGLDTVAVVWKDGTNAQGLQNQALMAAYSPTIDGDPWGDPRYDTNIPPQWQGIIGGTKVTRWGHVNICSLTPHHLPVPKKNIIDAASDPLELIRGYLYAYLDPPAQVQNSYEFMKVPFYLSQRPYARPMGGIRTAMWFIDHKRIFSDPPPKSYQESLYSWDADNELFFHPQSSGSQTVFSVELGETNDAAARPLGWGRFLAAIGATEITTSDLTGDGSLAYQDRFAPYDDFAAGVWTDMLQLPSQLGMPTHSLVYFGVRERKQSVPDPVADEPPEEQ